MADIPHRNPKPRIVIDLEIPLEDARNVLWRGRGIHAPMGKLLDEKKLDRGDLAWAADRFDNDPRFKEAVRTLLAHSLGAPDTHLKPERYGPEVIEASHYLHENETEHLVSSAFYAGFAYGLAVLALAIVLPFVIVAVLAVLAGNRPQFPMIGALALPFFLWLGWVLYRRIRFHVETYRDFRTGREGEDEAVEILRRSLDSRWTIFRHLQLPPAKGDVDLVLVGPGGCWAAEVKAPRGTVRVEGKKWEVQTKKGWRELHINPSRQVTRSATQLNDFLQRQGISRFVERAVLLAEPQPIGNLKASEIPVWLIPTLEDQVCHLETRKPPAREENERIVQVLKNHALQQRAVEEAQSKR